MLARLTHARTLDAGLGWLAGRAPGLTTVDGAASAVKLMLYDTRLHRISMRAASRANGEYEFEHLSMEAGRWMLIARDRTGEHNAVVADHLTAVLMPEFEP